MPNWIGDAVMAIPAISAIHEVYAETKIYIAAVESQRDIYNHLTFKPDGFIGLKSGKYSKNAKLINIVKADTIILFTNSFSSALEAFISGIPNRIGYRRDFRSPLLNQGIDKSPDKQHMIDYYNKLAEQTEITVNSTRPVLKAEKGIPDCLANTKYNKKKPLVGINPGAAYGEAKRWLPENFSKTAESLLNRGYQVVLFSGPGPELSSAREIARKQPEIINLAGKTSIEELINTIALCNLFITNDSGPMHLANALSIPVVAVFGPTDYHSTGPIQSQYRIITTDEECAPCMERVCPLKHHNCMKNITVDMVVSASLELLEQKGSL
jgi:heptosyltransferase-2